MEAGGPAYRLRYLAFDPETYDRYYNGITNRVLWFLHHYLWDTPRTPSFGRETAAAWEAFRRGEPRLRGGDGRGGSLAGSGGEARGVPGAGLPPGAGPGDAARASARRARSRTSPTSRSRDRATSRSFPRRYRDELLGGLLGADVLGFHSPEWAERFLLSCRTLGGARVDLRRRVVRLAGARGSRARVPDRSRRRRARGGGRPAGGRGGRARAARVEGDARLLLRVDRAELAKNILRGFLAFDRFLERRPEWLGRVKFLALLNPSREHIPEYGDIHRGVCRRR